MALGALALLPSAFQLYQGFRQRKMAKNLKPDNYIPGALREKEARTRTRTNVTSLPGQGRAEDKIKSTTANTVASVRRNAKDSSTVLEKVQEADAAEKAATGDLNARLEGFKMRAEDQLNSVLSEKAGIQKGNRDQHNAAKSALEGASSQNFFNAASNAATAGIILGGGGAGAATDGTPSVPSVTPPVNPSFQNMNPFNPMNGLTPDQIMFQILSGQRAPVGVV